MFKKILLLDTDLQKCQKVPMQLLLTSRIISRPFLESVLLLERGKIISCPSVLCYWSLLPSSEHVTLKDKIVFPWRKAATELWHVVI